MRNVFLLSHFPAFYVAKSCKIILQPISTQRSLITESLASPFLKLCKTPEPNFCFLCWRVIEGFVDASASVAEISMFS